MLKAAARVRPRGGQCVYIKPKPYMEYRSGFLLVTPTRGEKKDMDSDD